VDLLELIQDGHDFLITIRHLFQVHLAQGDQDIVKIVVLEFFVQFQLQILDEPLQQFGVKNQILCLRREEVTLLLNQHSHERGRLRDMYVSNTIWVKVLPDVNEGLDLIVCDPTVILALDIVEAL
jgi:hypothetical protein